MDHPPIFQRQAIADSAAKAVLKEQHCESFIAGIQAAEELLARGKLTPEGWLFLSDLVGAKLLGAKSPPG